MAVYLVTGKLGSGKTLACVGRIRDYLRQDRRVATNLDLHMDHLATSDDSRRYVMRVPDHPQVEDLQSLGRGQDGVEESRNGLLVLDECGAWLNTRAWTDKGRHAVIDWLLHSRKLGWDVILIVQDVAIIDKQVRTALAEFVVICKRADRLAIPLLTPICKLFGFNLRPPKIHLALVRYGGDPQAPVSDRWVYMAHDLYAAYDTRQIFRPDGDGLHCTLSRWHLVGRYKRKDPSFVDYLTALPGLPIYALWRLYTSLGGDWYLPPLSAPRMRLADSQPVATIRGFVAEAANGCTR